MIPIRQYYTEEVKSNYWKFICDVLKNSHTKDFLERLLNRKCAKYTLYDLICGDVNTLRNIIKEMGEASPVSTKGEKSSRKKKSYAKDQLKDTYASLRSRTSNNELKKDKKEYGINSLIDLVGQLGITVCPYCNRAFIFSTEREESIKTTCQIDHFFEKSKYPYLCLSLYNLIPVCSSCNHSKLDAKFEKSPFEIEDVDTGFSFTLEYIKAEYTKPDSFKVVTKTPDTELDEQRITLGLEKLYEKHNDIGHELFLKQHIYSEDRITELCKSFPELFTSPNEVRQLVLGNYIDKKDVGKRPLAKMTRDIMLQLKFIEE